MLEHYFIRCSGWLVTTQKLYQAMYISSMQFAADISRARRVLYGFWTNRIFSMQATMHIRV